MQDTSVHPIRTLHFPLAPHCNISDRLKELLSGEFAGPFVAIPFQPYALDKLIQPDTEVEERPKQWCVGCIRSGNGFRSFKPQRDALIVDFINSGRNRHWSCRPGRGVTITAYNMQVSGYLEGNYSSLNQVLLKLKMKMEGQRVNSVDSTEQLYNLSRLAI